MSEPCGILICAGGRPYRAIEIAKAYAGERGRIATFAEVLQAHLRRPDFAPLMNAHILTRTAIVLGRHPGKRRFTSFVSDECGLVEDVATLKRSYKDSYELFRNKKEVIGMPTILHYGAVPIDALQTFEQRDPRRRPIRTRITHQRDNIKQRRLDVDLDEQPYAVLGESSAQVIEHRRQTTKIRNLSGENRTTRDFRYCYDSWRRGELGFSLFHDDTHAHPDFLAGRHALVAPIVLLAYKDDTTSEPRVQGGPWRCNQCYVLAWRDVGVQDGDIVFDRGINELKSGRDDCFHPNEEALPKKDLFYFINAHTRPDGSEQLAAFDAVVSKKNGIHSHEEARCLVDVEKLGETVFEEYMLDFPCDPEKWAQIINNAPPGTQAIRFRHDRADVRVEHALFSMTIAKNLPVEYLKVTPRSPMRFLTADELLEDPQRYLRTMGAYG